MAARERLFYTTSVASLIVTAVLGYGIERTQFGWVLACYLCLFALYGWQLGIVRKGISITAMLTAAFGLRLALIGMIPNLSDDFFRFIWDGVLVSEGISPFAYLPSHFMEAGGGNPGQVVSGLSTELFEGMNSPEYYSVYPPVCQYLFGLGGLLFGGEILPHVILIRTGMVMSEVVTAFFLFRLLKRWALPKCYAAIYLLNPLVIVELIGNLHPEGLMIASLMATLWFLSEERYGMAGVTAALAVNTKLIPLLFGPWLLLHLGWKKSTQLVAVGSLLTVVLWAPLISLQTVQNLFDSLGLYFRSFEFNASIYYLIREIGFQITGYNIIATAGKLLAGASLLWILLNSWYQKEAPLKAFPTIALILLTGYYLLATTVHPWYITTLIAFSALSRIRYPLIWSALLPLTYHVYITNAYREYLWVVAASYLILFACLWYEWSRSEKMIVKSR